MNSQKSKERLEQLLETTNSLSIIDKKLLQDHFSKSLIQEIYKDCFLNKNILKAEKLYNLLGIEPSSDLLRESIDITIPFLCDIKGKFRYKRKIQPLNSEKEIEEINKNLYLFKPSIHNELPQTTYPLHINPNLTRTYLFLNTPHIFNYKNLVDLIEVINETLIQNKKYSWKIPIYTNVNILNNIIGSSYVLYSHVCAKVSKDQ